MPSKLQYLSDIRDHPGATGGEVAARVDSPEPAVLEGFRRARKQGLLTGDGARPEHFSLTEAGLTQLRVMGGEANPKPALSPNLEKEFSELDERVSDSAEDIRGLFRLVDDVLSGRRKSVARDTDTLADDLHEQVVTLEDELKKRSQVLEFYALRLALAVFQGKRELREMLAVREKALAPLLDSTTREQVSRLVALDALLAEEDAESQDEETSRGLRKELGLVLADLGETAESEEEDPDAEFWK